MEDKTTVAMEDENLNQANKTTYTAEEVKEMQSNSDKGVQKVIGEKKTLERVLDEVARVAENKDHLVDLHDESPEVAQIILDRYYEGQDIDSFKDSIGYKEDYSDPKMISKLAEKKARQMLEADKIAQAKTNFIQRLKMDGEELTQFQEAFSERMELKSFKASDIEKHLEKAYREVNDDPEVLRNLKNQEAIGKTMATGTGKSGNSLGSKKQTGAEKTYSEVGNFLDKFKTN